MGDGAGRGGRGGGGGGGLTQTGESKALTGTSERSAAIIAEDAGTLATLREGAQNRRAGTQQAIRTATEAGNTRALPGLQEQLRGQTAIGNRAVYLYREGRPVIGNLTSAAPIPTDLTGQRRRVISRALRNQFNNDQLGAARTLIQERQRNDRRLGRPAFARERGVQSRVISNALRMSK